MHQLAALNAEGTFLAADGILPVAMLSVPLELCEDCLPDGVRQISAHSEIPDIIVLTELGAARLLPGRLPPAAAAIVPIVVASQESPLCNSPANIRIHKLSKMGLADAVSLLLPTVERIRALPNRVWSSSDPREHLLARMAVRDIGLTPHRDPSRPDTIAYCDETVLPNVAGLAEELVNLGFLKRRFFDALTTCPRCESARVSVRELCGQCQSANLSEEAVLHHLRCSEQAPEREFRQGQLLICPKCRIELQIFSLDYDRPGNIMVCRDCDHVDRDFRRLCVP